MTEEFTDTNPLPDRIRPVFEQYRFGEYHGVVDALEEMVDFVNKDGSRPKLDELIQVQNRLVDELSRLQSWNEQTVRDLQLLKDEMVTRMGSKRFRDVNRGMGADGWWQGMVGEAFFKRIWPSAYLVSGDEQEVYRAFQEAMTDKAGIDFVDIVEYEGDQQETFRYLVCTQFKTTRRYPAGEIEMADLLNPSAANQTLIENVHLDDAVQLTRLGHTAKEVQKKYGHGDEQIAVLLVVLGMGMNYDINRFDGWKEAIRRADTEEMRNYFAGMLDAVLSNEEYIRPQDQAAARWYDNLFDEAQPLDVGEEKYRRLTTEYKNAIKKLPMREEDEPRANW